MLHPQLLRSLSRAKPFQPFRIVMTGGKTYDIRHPEWITVGRSWVTIYEADKPESGIMDRFQLVSSMLMEHTEFLPVSEPASPSS